MYVGAFDSKLYALDPNTGAVRWSFKTSDHIYASPALGEDASGQTDAIYIASANGSVYALTPQGRLLWSYDTGAPVRSSPALGAAPGADHSGIVYVGSSNGRLYAINANTGTPALVVQHDPEQSCSPRPQQPQCVAGARQDRGVHRRPGRLRLLRALRLLPAPARPSLLDWGDPRAHTQRAPCVPRRRRRQHHPELDCPRGFFGNGIQPTPGRPSARTDRERCDPQPRIGR